MVWVGIQGLNCSQSSCYIAAASHQFEVHLTLYYYLPSAVPLSLSINGQREVLNTKVIFASASMPLQNSQLPFIDLVASCKQRGELLGLPSCPINRDPPFPDISHVSLWPFLSLSPIAFANWLLRLRGTSRTALNYARVVPRFQPPNPPRTLLKPADRDDCPLCPPLAGR